MEPREPECHRRLRERLEEVERMLRELYQSLEHLRRRIDDDSGKWRDNEG